MTESATRQAGFELNTLTDHLGYLYVFGVVRTVNHLDQTPNFSLSNFDTKRLWLLSYSLKWLPSLYPPKGVLQLLLTFSHVFHLSRHCHLLEFNIDTLTGAPRLRQMIWDLR
jgi:hypothetical protein